MPYFAVKAGSNESDANNGSNNGSNRPNGTNGETYLRGIEPKRNGKSS